MRIYKLCGLYISNMFDNNNIIVWIYTDLYRYIHVYKKSICTYHKYNIKFANQNNKKNTIYIIYNIYIIIIYDSVAQ